MKIPAYINEKDVTTDWLDGIFDSLNFVENGCQIVGFVAETPVYAYWYANTIEWKIIGIGTRLETAKAELRKRLQNCEDPEQSVYSEIYTYSNILSQKFYFRNE